MLNLTTIDMEHWLSQCRRSSLMLFLCGWLIILMRHVLWNRWRTTYD